MKPCCHFLRDAMGLLLIRLSLPTLQVSQYEDIGSVGAEETMPEKQQGDFSGTNSSPTKSRKEILAAQFECYLKIITEPPRTDAGDDCAARFYVEPHSSEYSKNKILLLQNKNIPCRHKISRSLFYSHLQKPFRSGEINVSF